MPTVTQGVATSEGLVRTTESLCPACVHETTNAILTGQQDTDALRNEPGVIEARLLEKNGSVFLQKECTRHGKIEDLVASDARFFFRMEERSRAREMEFTGDWDAHQHGVMSIHHGKGALLVFDLTNRCNMKCSPCFMDANAVDHVHELSLDVIRGILSQARTRRPKDEVNILFSGGEPTLSPHFLEAVRYARELGFKRIYAATNGIRMAQEEGYAERCRDAGLHGVYLQLDGVGNVRNKHRGISNLFDVKLQALERLSAAGIQVSLQVTLINGVNHDQVGPIVEFAARHSDKVFGIIFQPIMLTGRDKHISDSERHERRYTLADLAAGLQSQVDADWLPLRDWWPADRFQTFGHLGNLLRQDSGASIGHAHAPNFSVFSPLVIDTQTGGLTPLGRFFDLDRFTDELSRFEAASGEDVFSLFARVVELANVCLDLDRAPVGFQSEDLLPIFEQCMARVNSHWSGWDERVYEKSRWRLMIAAGMWFQDLFNFDVRANRINSVRVLSQEGEISFCAYNSGGWREIVEYQHRTATLPEWHQHHGRHAIFAKGKFVPLDSIGVAVPVVAQATAK